jgi:hypothetical protein
MRTTPRRPALTSATLGLIACAVIGSPASAADMLDDLRLEGDYSWSRNHSKSDTRFTIGAFSATEHDEDTNAPEESYRAGIAWMRSLDSLRPGEIAGSFIYGTRVSYLYSSDSDPDIEFVSQGAVLDLFAGWAWSCAERCHVELAAVGGGGVVQSTLDSTIPGLTGSDTDVSPYFEYGARLASYYTAANGWQFGIQGSYTWGHLDSDFSITDGSTTVEASGRNRMENLAAGIGIGYRFR